MFMLDNRYHKRRMETVKNNTKDKKDCMDWLKIQS